MQSPQFRVSNHCIEVSVSSRKQIITISYGAAVSIITASLPHGTQGGRGPKSAMVYKIDGADA